MPRDRDNATVWALVLAAGSARRFGASKLLAEVDGMPLVRRAVRAAESACNGRSLLVVGHDRHRVSVAAAPECGFIVVNEHHAGGIGTSLALGARALAERADAIVVLLADQPLVTAAHVGTLVGRWTGAAGHIVATAYAGSAGPPILLPSGCFSDLVRLEGDAGAKPLLEDARFTADTVPFEAAAIDIDTPEDLSRIRRSARS